MINCRDFKVSKTVGVSKLAYTPACSELLALVLNQRFIMFMYYRPHVGAASEKIGRAALKSAVERYLTGNNIVICDGLNYIKGYRYELYCIARSAGTTNATVWVGPDSKLSDAVARNNARAASGTSHYDDGLLRDLWLRFEAPDERNRWDAPLFRVAGQPSSDATGSGVDHIAGADAGGPFFTSKFELGTIYTANELAAASASGKLVGAVGDGTATAIGGPRRGRALGPAAAGDGGGEDDDVSDDIGNMKDLESFTFTDDAEGIVAATAAKPQPGVSGAAAVDKGSRYLPSTMLGAALASSAINTGWSRLAELRYSGSTIVLSSADGSGAQSTPSLTATATGHDATSATTTTAAMAAAPPKSAFSKGSTGGSAFKRGGGGAGAAAASAPAAAPVDVASPASESSTVAETIGDHAVADKSAASSSASAAALPWPAACEAIAQSIASNRGLRATMATVQQPGFSSNFLFELDNRTNEVIAHITAAVSSGAAVVGDSLPVPGSIVPLQLSHRKPAPMELKRLKRSFEKAITDMMTAVLSEQLDAPLQAAGAEKAAVTKGGVTPAIAGSGTDADPERTGSGHGVRKGDRQSTTDASMSSMQGPQQIESIKRRFVEYVNLAIRQD